MWAIAVVAERHVAVMTKHSVAWGKPFVYEMLVEMTASSHLFAMKVTPTVNMVNGKKFEAGFAAAGTCWLAVTVCAKD